MKYLKELDAELREEGASLPIVLFVALPIIPLLYALIVVIFLALG